MEAVIRSATVAAARTRLSEVGAASAGSGGAREEGSEAARLAALRQHIAGQLEAQLREEYRRAHDAERARARSEGLADAHAAAARELAQARAALEAQFDSALLALREAARELAAGCEARIGEIAFAAVCKLVGRAALSEQFVLGLVSETCAQVRGAGDAVLKLHPRDLEVVQQRCAGQTLELHGMQLQLIADASLLLGGCRIEARGGYDASLEGQLRRLHRVLGGTEVSGSTCGEAS